jgi:asparagine synthetase B (glutamine-hydrolysing)
MFDAYQAVNDYSMMPTSVLARQIVEAFPNETIVWNGTNADALFGGLGKWRNARLTYRAPGAVRAAAGWMYWAGRFWARPTTPMEHRLCILRRTALWPYPAFALALHPMGEIAYRSPQAVRREIADALRAWLDTVAAALPPAVRPKVLTMAINACGKGCLKPAAVFENAGMTASFPFLDRDLVTFALQAATTWPPHLREGKAVLKELLTRSVPREMVYRPKSGFIIPAENTFGHRTFLNAFAEVIESSSGPFAGLLKRDVVRRIYTVMERREPLAWYTYEAMWCLVFGHHWILRAQQHASSTHAQADARPAGQTSPH